MEFLYTLKVTRAEMLSDGPTPDEEAATARHFEYLKGLNEKGTVLLAGRTQNTDESSFGIVIFEVDFALGLLFSQSSSEISLVHGAGR